MSWLGPELAHLFAIVLGPALICAALTALLVRAAPRLGLVDPPGGPDAARKRQSRPIPLVGGIAIAISLAATSFYLGRPWIDGWTDLPWAGLTAVVLAFLVGLWDDLAPHGLRPAAKAALQTVASTPLAYGFLEWNPGSWGGAIFVLLVAVAAQNAINTFDNSDGSAALLCAGALITPWPLPVAGAAVVGFLPWNLLTRRRAYLGDAGSHMLGMIIAAWPPAWLALTLPLADLARLSVLRLRERRRPWHGDRRHLAHRLEVRGLSSVAVAMVQLAIALPSIAGGLALYPYERGDLAIGGILATLALFAIALRWAPDPQASGSECAARRDA